MRCDTCRKKTIPITCKYCNIDFCIRCLLPETHECKNLKECKIQSRATLSNQLNDNKLVGDKVRYRI